MSKEIEFIIETDTYYTVRTLKECKSCVYGEDDLYWVKDGKYLYYADTYIGCRKELENRL